ncbi:hypothetical protein PsorP6_016808 [Peronosclerospora sorghi]|uniref:Uncharacterized protein n=1 Tax=Peronosclerospora sorghi TaxID=230839 RepID=A0ACC0WED9_9STRA|nr:hypothetical protein PsorP6_016808 [Peronosclerospora sorghi]
MPYASEVARVVLEWFESASDCEKKLRASEWTVLAGIVLQTRVVSASSSTQGKEAASADTFRVLSAATGTKCLGRRDLHASGLVVNDCHAEVLARRALLRYLYVEALAWETDGRESTKQQSIFQRHPTTARLVLQPHHSLHLFISESPCGDAAIYELREHVVDRLVQQRARGSCWSKEAQEHKVARTELRVTGAKRSNVNFRAKSQEGKPTDKRFAQTVGIARVKPGRSDLPPDKQTLSMSCSDKLAKWIALGLQGSLLLQWFEPLYLTSIVVSEDDRAKSVTNQEHALERAVCARLGQDDAGGREHTVFSCCKVHVVSGIPPFSRRRTSIRTPSSLALNWTIREDSWAGCHEPQPSASSILSSGNGLEPFFQSFALEFLEAATGFKQGAKKASKMNPLAMERAASRLSKRTFLRAFYHVLSQTSGHDTVRDVAYLELKQIVPLHVSSTAADAVSTFNVSHKWKRKQFYAAWNEWIGVPETFKQFQR